MKRTFHIALCCLLFSIGTAKAQKKSVNRTKSTSTEDELPVMYQFETNYAEAQLKSREALLVKIRALDTLQISEKKRLRLIKALYKDLNSEKFQKTILAEAQFEDDDYED